MRKGFNFDEGIAPRGGLEAGDEPSLHIGRGLPAPEELRLVQGALGELTGAGLFQCGQLRARLLSGLQAQGQPPRLFAIVRTGMPQDPQTTGPPSSEEIGKYFPPFALVTRSPSLIATGLPLIVPYLL